MHEHHAIDYIEFAVADMAASKAFYESVFGWRFNDYGPDYAGIQGANRELGGFSKGTPRPGGALIVLYSDDLDESYKAVLAAGVEVVKQPFEFPGGRRFEFKDLNGYDIAVWANQ